MSIMVQEIKVTPRDELEMVRALRKLPVQERPSAAKDMLVEKFGRYALWVVDRLVSKSECPVTEADTSFTRKYPSGIAIRF